MERYAGDFFNSIDPQRSSGSEDCCIAMGHFLEAGLTRYDALSKGEVKV